MTKLTLSAALAGALITAGSFAGAQPAPAQPYGTASAATQPALPPPPPGSPAPWEGANVPPPPPIDGSAPYGAAPQIPQPPPPVIIDRQSRSERVLFEIGGGLGAGLVIGGIGLYVGIIAGAASTRTSSSTLLASMAIGGVIGASVGVPVGVYLVGNNFRGNGGLGWTLLGSAAGGAAAFGLAMLTGESDGDLPLGVPIIGGLVLPVAGAVIGYELTSDADSRHPRAQAPRVVPMSAALPGGGIFGLAGTF